jgi:hypothetical protein
VASSLPFLLVSLLLLPFALAHHVSKRGFVYQDRIFSFAQLYCHSKTFPFRDFLLLTARPGSPTTLACYELAAAFIFRLTRL